MTSLLSSRPELIRLWVTRLTFLPHPLLLSFFSQFGDMAIAFNMPLTFLSHFHWLLSSSYGCPGLSLGVNVVSSPPALPPLLHQGSRGEQGGGSGALGGYKCLQREDGPPRTGNAIQAVWGLEQMKRSLITVTANAKTSPVSKHQKMRSKGGKGESLGDFVFHLGRHMGLGSQCQYEMWWNFGVSALALCLQYNI